MGHGDENPGVTRVLLRDHWAVESNFPRSWNDRAKIAAEFIGPDEKVVSDIGCGPHQPLRQFLPKGSTYLPADLRAWSHEVEVCDLNDLQFPRSASECDVICLLGVLEYLFDVEMVLRSAVKECKVLVFSYCSTDDLGKRMPLWVNAYSGADILRIMRNVGLVTERLVAYKTGQYVIRARRLG